MENRNEMRLKQKAKFYYNERLECHIVKEPKGFINGFFKSDLIDGLYYLFEDQRFPDEQKKLFLWDIFDISDYEVEVK